jgi:hypothetical protein
VTAGDIVSVIVGVVVIVVWVFWGSRRDGV